MSTIATANAALVTGINNVSANINQLRTTMEDIETDKETRRTTPKTFTDKHGAQAAAFLHSLTGAAGDDQLPPLLQRLAANKDKSQDFATIDLALYNIGAGDPHINQVNMPRATPHMIALLRNFNFIGLGLELGQGLTPFAIQCQGHPQSKAVLDLAQQQQSVEAGNNTVTLSEATTFRLKDVRFPRTLIQVVDRLRAYKVVCQAIFGDTNTYVTSLNTGLNTLSPMIQQWESIHAPKDALTFALRVMLWIQQASYLYWNRLRENPATPPTLPDYEGLAHAICMGTHDMTLPRIPNTWMTEVRAQLPDIFPSNTNPPAARIRGGGGGTNTQNRNERARKVTNTQVDRTIKQRWTAAGEPTIRTILEGYTGTGDPPIPEYSSGLPVCLNWACKGHCNDSCERKEAHKSYGPALTAKIKNLLDQCGLA
jgi:hypothetical protein